ncbi:cysteine--tRNA ligase [Candidatus Saccharibacteria bacterium]|nr:cysteine--tRNA ligase [Candidatus Saccharibacteria bacterium]
MLKLYNTSTRKIEVFKPLSAPKVTIYTCGPTVYSSPHLGNFAAYIYWDLLLRVLKANGYAPKRILNLTDVGHLTSDGDTGEDKLEKGAKREGKTVWQIADTYIAEFKQGYKELKLLEPSAWARATDYIAESQALVDALTKRGFTYETADGIYFDTAKFPAYANFARLDLQNLKAGARVDYSKEKHHVSDFAVWKFIKPGENHAMHWDYLGRSGYPGWHLECSSIIHTLLGEPIDIHTGGVDHIPVHHTNEIAQTFGAFGSNLANFWLHCNFIRIDGEKISKSLGNIITLSDIKNRSFSPADFKLWLYQGHYRSERNFTWDDLAAAKARRLKWQNAIAMCYQTPQKPAKENFKQTLLTCLNEDLSSASAFALIDEHLNSLSLDDWQYVENIFALSLFPTDITPQVLPLINARNAARQTKDYQTADHIRDKLAAQNLTLLDTSEGTFWQLKD